MNNTENNILTDATNRDFEVDLVTSELLDWLDLQNPTVELELSDVQKFENGLRQREIERARVAERFAPAKASAAAARKTNRVLAAWARS